MHDNQLLVLNFSQIMRSQNSYILDGHIIRLSAQFSHNCFRSYSLQSNRTNCSIQHRKHMSQPVHVALNLAVKTLVRNCTILFYNIIIQQYPVSSLFSTLMLYISFFPYGFVPFSLLFHKQSHMNFYIHFYKYIFHSL